MRAENIINKPLQNAVNSFSKSAPTDTALEQAKLPSHKAISNGQISDGLTKYLQQQEQLGFLGRFKERTWDAGLSLSCNSIELLALVGISLKTLGFGLVSEKVRDSQFQEITQLQKLFDQISPSGSILSKESSPLFEKTFSNNLFNSAKHALQLLTYPTSLLINTVLGAVSCVFEEVDSKFKGQGYAEYVKTIEQNPSNVRDALNLATFIVFSIVTLGKLRVPTPMLIRSYRLLELMTPAVFMGTAAALGEQLMRVENQEQGGFNARRLASDAIAGALGSSLFMLGMKGCKNHCYRKFADMSDGTTDLFDTFSETDRLEIGNQSLSNLGKIARVSGLGLKVATAVFDLKDTNVLDKLESQNYLASSKKKDLSKSLAATDVNQLELPPRVKQYQLGTLAGKRQAREFAPLAPLVAPLNERNDPLHFFSGRAYAMDGESNQRRPIARPTKEQRAAVLADKVVSLVESNLLNSQLLRAISSAIKPPNYHLIANFQKGEFGEQHFVDNFIPKLSLAEVLALERVLALVEVRQVKTVEATPELAENNPDERSQSLIDQDALHDLLEFHKRFKGTKINIVLRPNAKGAFTKSKRKFLDLVDSLQALLDVSSEKKKEVRDQALKILFSVDYSIAIFRSQLTDIKKRQISKVRKDGNANFEKPRVADIAKNLEELSQLANSMQEARKETLIKVVEHHPDEYHVEHNRWATKYSSGRNSSSIIEVINLSYQELKLFLEKIRGESVSRLRICLKRYSLELDTQDKIKNLRKALREQGIEFELSSYDLSLACLCSFQVFSSQSIGLRSPYDFFLMFRKVATLQKQFQAEQSLQYSFTTSEAKFIHSMLASFLIDLDQKGASAKEQAQAIKDALRILGINNQDFLLETISQYLRKKNSDASHEIVHKPFIENWQNTKLLLDELKIDCKVFLEKNKRVYFWVTPNLVQNKRLHLPTEMVVSFLNDFGIVPLAPRSKGKTKKEVTKEDLLVFLRADRTTQKTKVTKDTKSDEITLVANRSNNKKTLEKTLEFVSSANPAARLDAEVQAAALSYISRKIFSFYHIQSWGSFKSNFGLKIANLDIFYVLSFFSQMIDFFELNSENVLAEKTNNTFLKFLAIRSLSLNLSTEQILELKKLYLYLNITKKELLADLRKSMAGIFISGDRRIFYHIENNLKQLSDLGISFFKEGEFDALCSTATADAKKSLQKNISRKKKHLESIRFSQPEDVPALTQQILHLERKLQN